jgi:hypothetical protein
MSTRATKPYTLPGLLQWFVQSQESKDVSNCMPGISYAGGGPILLDCYLGAGQAKVGFIKEMAFRELFGHRSWKC